MGTEMVHVLIERAGWQELLQRCGRALARRPQNQLAAEVLRQVFARQLGNVSSAELEHTCIRAVTLLEQNYRATRQWERLAELLQIHVENCQDAGQRAELLVRVARVYEDEMDEAGLAFGTLGRALREQPRRQDLRDDLERLAEKGERWEELAGLFLDAAEGQDGEWALDLRRRAAHIFEKRLKDPDQAIRQWRHLLDLHGNDSEALVALWRLEAERQADRARKSSGCSASDPAGSPDDEELSVLEGLYRDNQNYAELVEVLRLQASRESDAGRRKRLYYEIADLAVGKLGRPREAIQAYLDLLARDLGNLSVIKRLNRLYLEENQQNGAGQPGAM